jgi:peptidoglycan/LPS O-acetylase OafA/YrhL
MAYFRQLDSLRAIAVLLVIIHHWGPPGFFLSKLEAGPIGVTIFFVLSGFLITRILLQAREVAKEKDQPVGSLLKPFYFRRALRIFPIYYLTLAFLWLFHEQSGTSIRDSIGYFLTYTSNFYFYSLSDWDGITSHLWTLAVEEQFYLVWPFLMLFVRKQHLLPVMLLFTAIGVGSQYYFRDHALGGILTTSCFDSFGMGGILAWLCVHGTHHFDRTISFLQKAVLLTVPVLVLDYFLADWFLLPFRLAVSLWSMVLLAGVVRGTFRRGLVGKVLDLTALQFVGRISYGLYLYHYIIPQYLRGFFMETLHPLLPFGLSNKTAYVLFQVEMLLVLLLFSWFSWVLIEKPLLRFKDRFEYSRPGPEKVPLVAAES